MAEVHNYTWDQGEDLVIALTYEQGPAGAEVPVNLTGYSVRMDMVTPAGQRVYTFNSEALADVDPVMEGAQPDSETEATLTADGKIRIIVPRSLTLPNGAVYQRMTAATPITTFNYDTFLRNNTGDDNEYIPVGRQKKILKGQITVEKSYTLWL